MIKHFIHFLLISILLTGCSGCGAHKEVKSDSYQVSTDELIKMNRKMVNQEIDVINRYVKEQNLKMTKTSTGMWYKIDVEGNGANVKVGQTVTINYSIKLLNGTLCYTSDSLGTKTFRLGQGGVESGLEEGLLLMKKSSKATFIMPSHLGYGLSGNQDKIPPRSILIYEAEILDVK